jgi:hypothetical protein
MRSFRELLKDVTRDEYGWYITAFANIHVVQYGTSEIAEIYPNFVNVKLYARVSEFMKIMSDLCDPAYRLDLIQTQQKMENTNKTFEDGYGIE